MDQDGEPVSVSEPFFVLAPMDDVTDVVFRSVVADCAAPDLFFTEFVNVDGLQSPGRPKLLHKLAISRPRDHYIIAQIWGKNPENFEKTAAELVDMGFDGVDINMGCPEKNIVKNGCCSALINNPELAGEIIKSVQRGVAGRVPVSVKTRLGWSEIDFSWHEYLLGFGLDMLTVHLRTRSEMSEVPAHWDKLAQIIQLRDRLSPATKIVGNGDVASKALGLSLAAQTGADGVMIGRGVFKDPYCFADDSPWPSLPAAKKIKLFKTHVERFKATYAARERSFLVLKRFCKVYINGFDNASELREKIMACQSIDEMLALL
jgi:tRNA-dihydrouridine synthase